MAEKANIEKAVLVGKLKLFNSRTRQAIMVAADELMDYDVRLWRVIDDK